MDDGRQRLGRLAVDPDVEPDEVGPPPPRDVVLDGGVALGPRLDLVEKVADDSR